MSNITFDYSDKTAVVTGASSGIGREIALRFGEAGATVINADVQRNPKDEGIEVTTDEAITDVGGNGKYIDIDVSDPDQIANAVKAAREFGGLM